MATTLGNKNIGDVVRIRVSGALRDFIIVHKNAPSSAYPATDFNNAVILMQSNVDEPCQWRTAAPNDYANSGIHAWLNGEYLNSIEQSIRNQIRTVRIPYRAGGSGNTISSGASGLSCRIFIPSIFEVGYDTSIHDWITTQAEGARFQYFSAGTGTAANNLRIGRRSGSAARWWLRSPVVASNANNAWAIETTGAAFSTWNVFSTGNNPGPRPAFVLPSSLFVTADGSVVVNIAPTTPDSITVPATVNGGESITVSWGKSTHVRDSLAGYRLERSANGGAWSQVYQGTALSSSQAVTKGWNTVAFRVKAYESLDNLESGWRTSDTRTVINNTPPTAPGVINYPSSPRAGKPITITWGESTDPDGDPIKYVVEHRADNGVFAQVVITSELSSEVITPSSGTYYQARVKAVDEPGDESAYTTGAQTLISYNDPPEITGEDEDLGDLTATGLVYTYTVTDDKPDDISVVVTLAGETYQTLIVKNGAENTLLITGEDWQKVLNGSNMVKITATDTQGASTVRTLTFSKNATELEFYLNEPRHSAGKPYRIAVNLSAVLPAGCETLIEVCNNAFDDSPYWEDITASVATNRAHIFTNTECAAGRWGVDLHVHIKRGDAAGDLYISGFTYAFETENSAVQVMVAKLEQTEQLLDMLLTEVIPTMLEVR